MTRQAIGGVLLAAGRSSRVGSMKQLLDWRGRTLLRHVTQVLLDADLDPVLVVLGHEADRLRREVEDLPVRVVENVEYDWGMFSSVQCGLRAFCAETDMCVLALVDQPAIDAGLIRDLIREHTRGDALVTMPVYAGQSGHPVVLDRQVIDAVVHAPSDVTLRDVLTGFADSTRRIEVGTDSVLHDIDTMADYERQQRELRRDRPVEPPEEPTP